MSFADARRTSTLALVQVVRTEQVSPTYRRVTVGGDQLEPMPDHGFDHWFRLFLPKEEGATSFDLPDRYNIAGYLRYRRMPADIRPHVRNYTVRSFRPADRELDIDFAIHGDDGIATRWATRARPGDTVALLDQGRGYEIRDGIGHHLLVTDETGVPAVLGILRSLPRDARGSAWLEVPHADDVQPDEAPDGVSVHWLVREPGARPATTVLAAVQEQWEHPGEPVGAFLVGEQSLPTTLRKWLITERGVDRAAIVFSGYWRLGKR